MASASSSLHISMTLQCPSSSHRESIFVGHPRPNLNLPRHTFNRSSSVLAFSRRRDKTQSAITPPKKKKQSLPHSDVGEDDLDEDAFEALFRQLEEDLKNDDLSANYDDNEISEEDLAKLERELEEALGDDELSEVLGSTVEENNGKEVEDEDNDDEDEPVNLKNWQLRRLGYALKTGRRKTSIKNLAAELCLDRAVVLDLLRDPPPNLLMMSAALPDRPVSTVPEPETKPLEIDPVGTATDAAKPETNAKVPVHVMQGNWSAQKRLKKVQVETLERVYQRTKRPTVSKVSS
ncbi:unnamed protein product [Ilex paraguariensis]|uniref:Protein OVEREXPRESSOR OF CATIONIC PEROXIDASE 3 n=1 Tax=Ilex paraguariensis TaxID=185542 RepID=A0ABC8SAW6_9AQUA